VTTERAFTVDEVSWTEAGPALTAIRFAVFVEEQGVPAALELDGLDPQCRHVLARDARGAPVGTARLLPDGHIGRMAVSKPWRRAGVGSAMLAKLIALSRARGDRVLILNAQSYVTAFYRRAGFEVSSAAFVEAGIPHVEMRRFLRDP
jgi:predicted GNAT family N-acyltransferase